MYLLTTLLSSRRTCTSCIIYYHEPHDKAVIYSLCFHALHEDDIRVWSALYGTGRCVVSMGWVELTYIGAATDIGKT